MYGLACLNPPAQLEKDPAAGRLWLGKAVTAGDKLAAYVLGYAYLSGWAGIADPARGATLVRQAAEGGVVPAMKLSAALSLPDGGRPKMSTLQSASFAWR